MRQLLSHSVILCSHMHAYMHAEFLVFLPFCSHYLGYSYTTQVLFSSVLLYLFVK